MNNYSVGLYIRLSKEDDDKVFESESISNQKSILIQYVKENNLKVYDYYIDDGYSGTNYDRPAFIRLLKDIEDQKINMVITKDMSRLGRDYIKTGELLERYFPEHSVRYIAVTDNIDTYLDNSNNDIAPFKAIMNDMYAKDISKKIKSSLKAKMKEGKWVGGRSPFGYDIDPNNKNSLIINEDKARIVKKIYNMSLNGLTFYKIAKQLTIEGIKTPAQYYNFKWKNNYNIKYGNWHPKTIRDILTNEIYIGNMVQSKRSKVNYKIKKIVRNNPKDFIVVKNTHDAIIDKETFYEVQKRMPKNVGRNEKKENYLLDGLLYCGDCGHRISVTPRRKKDNSCYTICNYYRTYMKQRLCTTHSNNYEKLEKEIISIIKEICLNNINKEYIKKSVKNNYKKNYLYNENNLELLHSQIQNIKDNLDIIYFDKINKNITQEQFNRLNTKLNKELNAKQNEINNISININRKIDNKKIEKYIDKYLRMKTISREIVVNLVEKIVIFDDKKIDVIFICNKK